MRRCQVSSAEGSHPCHAPSAPFARLAAGLAAVLCFSPVAVARAQEAPLWLRYPAISPDGRTIVFAFKGDLYTRSRRGRRRPRPLTLGESYEFSPVWSHDGRSIAFASDRYGNFDVFVMPATGGEATRLTFHSTREMPSTFTADDKAVLFSAYRQELATDAQFPIGLMTQLYSVPVTGGRVGMVLPVPAVNATVDASGGKVIYEDVKGYEDQWRKHHTSAVTRDVWVYDMATKAVPPALQLRGREPQPGLRRRRRPLLLPDRAERLVQRVPELPVRSGHQRRRHALHAQPGALPDPRRTRGCSASGTDGEIYTMAPGAEPTKVPIRIAADGRSALDKIVPVNEHFTEATLSPNGKEFAYVFRGEIFVTSMEGGVTKRITNTPWQERSVHFSPDGRSLVYAAERDSSWNVYTTTIVRKDEPYFFASTVLEEKPVVATTAEEYQPTFSPDGKEVAYLENRVVLKVANLASGRTRTIMTADHNYSYSDGDQYYQWSPDGKWFLVQFGYHDRIFTPAGRPGVRRRRRRDPRPDPERLRQLRPKWVLDGKAMIWGSDREGTRAQGGGLTSGDVYAMFFSRAAWDRFRLTKEELALVKEKEGKEDAATTAAKKDAGQGAARTPRRSRS